jgi:hypothetical protein
MIISLFMTIIFGTWLFLITLIEFIFPIYCLFLEQYVNYHPIKGKGGWVDLRADLDDLEKRKFLILPGLELQPLCRPACR